MLSGLDPCDEMCNISHKFGRRDQDPIHKESVSCYQQKEQTYLIKLFFNRGKAASYDGQHFLFDNIKL